MGLQRLAWNYTGSTFDDRTYFTPPDQFYHVDHGSIPAPIAPESWTLQIAGRVAAPQTFTLADLQSRIASRGITRYVKCLQCLRDPLGDNVEKRWYASSGLWGGLPLAALLEEVGISPGSTRIDYGGRDPSGFFASMPLDLALCPPDGLPVLLATELNTAPLAHLRGGPVRVLVPNLLGFKSVKWVSWMCVTDAQVPNGWYERGRGVRLPPGCKDPTLKTMARIAPVLDAYGQPMHPRHSLFPCGRPLSFRGYAVPGPRGLAGVRFEVCRAGPARRALIDDGYACLEAPGNWGLPAPLPVGVVHFQGDRPDSWPLSYSWVYWQAGFGPLPPGRYRFAVWAVDHEGHEQPMPDPNEHSGSARREQVVFRVS
ncbi:MAG TPA: molybdopterin-dependent oxidoreductase [Isosphaeraceae bacterium]|jgi:DMSO/TMAO reductase YedYZ molybdopterin-dependent catalytic subunit|nr:molybdopterin-dependent oxidoreductase [Isosphaeraceae bacterium]